MTESQAQKLEAMLSTLWNSNRATILERLETLRDAHSKLADGFLDAASRKNAEGAAHKLAGVLGTFGLPQGSKLASGIEAFLAKDRVLSTEDSPQLEALLSELEAVVASKP